MSELEFEDASRSEAYSSSREDRDRTLAAVRDLEAALARAAGSIDWQAEVVASLVRLEEAMTIEQGELKRPDSLLALIASDHSRLFGSRIRSFKEQYDDIARQTRSLRAQIEGAGEDGITADEVRHRVGWIIAALRHCRARQTDLVFEAVTLDLGAR
jgi:hypothetical protein